MWLPKYLTHCILFNKCNVLFIMRSCHVISNFTLECYVIKKITFWSMLIGKEIFTKIRQLALFAFGEIQAIKGRRIHNNCDKSGNNSNYSLKRMHK